MAISIHSNSPMPKRAPIWILPSKTKPPTIMVCSLISTYKMLTPVRHVKLLVEEEEARRIEEHAALMQQGGRRRS